eukprot:scaffold45433_cov32-Tisochrysis_lutea.AAC.2
MELPGAPEHVPVVLEYLRLGALRASRSICVHPSEIEEELGKSVWESKRAACLWPDEAACCLQFAESLEGALVATKAGVKNGMPGLVHAAREPAQRAQPLRRRRQREREARQHRRRRPAGSRKKNSFRTH